jgi:uridine kinase
VPIGLVSGMCAIALDQLICVGVSYTRVPPMGVTDTLHEQVMALTSDAAIPEFEPWIAEAGTDTPLVVAVDGHSAAGKSTFSQRLAERVDAALVSGDDFYRVMPASKRTMLGPADGADLYYDWERMRDEALRPLHEGRDARYRPYDWESNSLMNRTVSITPQPVVIVDGLFVSRPELDCFNDRTVLVMADPEVRLRRQLDRADATRAWLERWDAAESWYFARIRRPQDFDLIVCGNTPA